MGLDLGFEAEGFETRVVVEQDRAAVATILANRPNTPIVTREKGRPARIEEVSTEELLVEAGLAVGEPVVLLGAPPCEPYSTAGRRNGKADHRADGINEFIRIVNESRPQYFVLEEVDSFRSAAIQHISFYERIARDQSQLPREQQLGSFFEEIMGDFEDTGYYLSFDPRETEGFRSRRRGLRRASEEEAVHLGRVT